MTNDFANCTAYSPDTVGICNEQSNTEFCDRACKENGAERKRRSTSYVRHILYLHFLFCSDVFVFVKQYKQDQEQFQHTGGLHHKPWLILPFHFSQMTVGELLVVLSLSKDERKYNGEKQNYVLP